MASAFLNDASMADGAPAKRNDLARRNRTSSVISLDVKADRKDEFF
jgi:hypothetical protein